MVDVIRSNTSNRNRIVPPFRLRTFQIDDDCIYRRRLYSVLPYILQLFYRSEMCREIKNETHPLPQNVSKTIPRLVQSYTDRRGPFIWWSFKRVFILTKLQI